MLEFRNIAFLNGITSNLFVVSLQRGQIFPGLGELAFFHTLSDVPVNESTLGVHQIEFMRQCRPSLGDSGGVGQHATNIVSLCGRLEPDGTYTARLTFARSPLGTI